MAFSASDAAFEGFRIVRRTPLAVVGWTLLHLAVFGLTFALVGRVMIDLTQQAEAIRGVSEPSMEQLAPLLQGYALVFGVAGPLSVLASTMLTTAIVRTVLEPDQKRLGFMRLGMDEVRVFGVYLIQFILLGIYYVAVMAICIMIGAMAKASGQPWLFIPCFLLAIAGVIGLVWIAVKLSLTAPIIVAEKRFALFDSFKLTKGHFWPLLGMAILAGVMAIVIAILGMVIALPFQSGLAGPIAQIEEGAALLPLLTQHAPFFIGWAVVNALISALQLAVVYAPFSAAYRDIKGLS